MREGGGNNQRIVRWVEVIINKERHIRERETRR